MSVNKKIKARYAEIAQFLGLCFNEEYCVVYGEKDGFTLLPSAAWTMAGVSSMVWSAYRSVCLRMA